MGKTVDDPSISTVEDSLLAEQDIKLKNITEYINLKTKI